ncbi:phosphotransferase [Rhodoferax koreense]|nr:phosphotransferase [Rhodoferax koreense]
MPKIPEFDLSRMATPFVPVAESEAQSIASRIYGLQGRLTRFATEKDDTYRLDSPCGAYVLKLANPADAQDELDFQVRLLEHIAKVSPDLPIPRIVRTLTGKTHASILDHAGQTRLVRLMSFVDGTPLDASSANGHQRRLIGAMLARLRLATEGFVHAASHRFIPWDVKNIESLEFLVANIDDGFQRGMLVKGLQKLAPLLPRIHALRKQVLHNDFSKSNIVVDPSTAAFVTGIIDFGDAVHTAIAIDVSTALLNQLPRNSGTLPSQDMFAAGRDVLHGYLANAELHAEELELIPHLVMARVIARALLSISLAKQFPENSAYLLRNTLQGWAQLQWFLNRSHEEISAAILVADPA